MTTDPFHPASPEALALLAKSAALIKEASAMRNQAHAMIASEIGVAPGQTRVKQDGLVGCVQEVLNYVDGRLYVAVKLEPPLPERHGSRRKFYGDWEVVVG